jgi:hypothetical protein
VPDEGFFRAARTRPGPRVHGARYGSAPGGAPSEDGTSRRPRWDIDAGITERDEAALYWLGQQYAARSDVLRVLLGRLSPGSPKVAGQLSEQTLRQILKRFASSGDSLIVHHRDRPQWRRNEYASQWVARMRWMPRSAAAVTSARVSAARLASSTPLRLAHSPSTGLSSGA